MLIWPDSISYWTESHAVLVKDMLGRVRPWLSLTFAPFAHFLKTFFEELLSNKALAGTGGAVPSNTPATNSRKWAKDSRAVSKSRNTFSPLKLKWIRHLTHIWNILNFLELCNTTIYYLRNSPKRNLLIRPLRVSLNSWNIIAGGPGNMGHTFMEIYGDIWGILLGRYMGHTFQWYMGIY